MLRLSQCVFAFFLCDVLGTARASSLCERVEERREKQTDATLGLLQAAGKRPGTESKLDTELDALSLSGLKDVLEPYFRSLFDQTTRTCSEMGSSTRPLIALLVSGDVRTMLEPEIVRGYQNLVARLLESGDVRIFAYLNLDPGPTFSQSLAMPGFKFHDKKWAPPYDIDQPAVEAALGTWGANLGFELELHQENHPLLPRLDDGSCGPQGLKYLAELASRNKTLPGNFYQLAKVSASVAMMNRYESTSGRLFNAVARVRPDFCPASIERFLEFSIPRVLLPTSTGDPIESGGRGAVAFLINDAAAVLPRWAIGALSSAWRTLVGQRAGCGLDPSWLTDEVVDMDAPGYPRAGVLGCTPRRTLNAHFEAAGIVALDLHEFWAKSMPEGGIVPHLQPNEPSLRRPHGCAAFT